MKNLPSERRTADRPNLPSIHVTTEDVEAIVEINPDCLYRSQFWSLEDVEGVNGSMVTYISIALL